MTAQCPTGEPSRGLSYVATVWDMSVEPPQKLDTGPAIATEFADPGALYDHLEATLVIDKDIQRPGPLWATNTEDGGPDYKAPIGLRYTDRTDLGHEFRVRFLSPGEAP